MVFARGVMWPVSEYICPGCKKPIYDDDALLCLYCGESLGRRPRNFHNPRLLFILFVILVLFAFIAFMAKMF